MRRVFTTSMWIRLAGHAMLLVAMVVLVLLARGREMEPLRFTIYSMFVLAGWMIFVLAPVSWVCWWLERQGR